MNMIGILSNLSGGKFQFTDLVQMEKEVLSALNWRMHPPTSNCVLHYLLLLPQDQLTPDIRLTLTRLSFFFTPISVCDYFFTTVPPFLIAASSLLNSFEIISHHDLPSSTRETFFDIISAYLDLSQHNSINQNLSQVRNRLWIAYERSEGYFSLIDRQKSSNTILHHHYHKNTNHQTTTITASPVCVSRPPPPK